MNKIIRNLNDYFIFFTVILLPVWLAFKEVENFFTEVLVRFNQFYIPPEFPYFLKTIFLVWCVFVIALFVSLILKFFISIKEKQESFFADFFTFIYWILLIYFVCKINTWISIIIWGFLLISFIIKIFKIEFKEQKNIQIKSEKTLDSHLKVNNYKIDEQNKEIHSKKTNKLESEKLENNDTILVRILKKILNKDIYFISLIFIFLLLLWVFFWGPLLLNYSEKLFWIIFNILIFISIFLAYKSVLSLIDPDKDKDKFIAIILTVPIFSLIIVFCFLFILEIFWVELTTWFKKTFIDIFKDYLNSWFLTIYWSILWVIIWFYLLNDKQFLENEWENKKWIKWILFLIFVYLFMQIFINYFL